MEPTATIERTSKCVELVTFYLGGSLYGVDILQVQEINKAREWTPVPHSEDYVKGILSLRGQIVTIQDLGLKLGLAPTALTEEARTLVMNSEGQHCVGFLVDRIGCVTNAAWDQLCTLPADMPGVQGRYLEGVLKTEAELIAVLNVEELFGDRDHAKQESAPLDGQ